MACERDGATVCSCPATRLYSSLDRLVGFLGQKRVKLASKDLVLGDAREALAKARGETA
jgi:hypothetical protein